MRQLVIYRLTIMLAESLTDSGYGIPRYFDCPKEENIFDASEFEEMSDQELLRVFEAVISFQG